MNICLLVSPNKNKIAQEIQNYLSGRGHLLDVVAGPALVETLDRADLGLSYGYRHILAPCQFYCPVFGVMNLHTGYLPAGRGAMPNVWAIVDNLKAGVTLHWIDAGTDSGPILARRSVGIEPIDTGETLDRRLKQAALDLFVEVWPELEDEMLAGQRPVGETQPPGLYQTRRSQDVLEIDDLEFVFGNITAHRFVNILRARTFSGHEAAFVRDSNGEKIYVRATLSRD